MSLSLPALTLKISQAQSKSNSVLSDRNIWSHELSGTAKFDINQIMNAPHQINFIY